MTFVKDDSPEEHGNAPCFSVQGNPLSSSFSVTYGDRPIEHIKSLTIKMSATELPEVTITLVAGAVDIEMLSYLNATTFVTNEQMRKLKNQRHNLFDDDDDDDEEPF